jgi:hypothetical protein
LAEDPVGGSRRKNHVSEFSSGLPPYFLFPCSFSRAPSAGFSILFSQRELDASDLAAVDAILMGSGCGILFAD